MGITLGSERTITGVGGGVFSYSKDGDVFSSYNNTTAASSPEVAAVITPSNQSTLQLAYSTGSGKFSDDDEYTLVKTNAGVQGYGVCSPLYTLHPRHLGRVLQISFDYTISANASNYSDGDLTLWIVDVTNSTIIQPVSYTIMKGNTGVPIKHIASFQTPSNGSTFKFVIHQSTVNSNPYTFKFSDIKISEPTQSVGAVITDWSPFTMNITALTTAPTKATSPEIDNAQWRRNGSNMEITWTYHSSTGTGQTPGSGLYFFNLPSGYAIDSNKISISPTAMIGICGTMSHASGGDILNGNIFAYNTTQLVGYAGDEGSTYQAVTSSFASLVSSAARTYSFQASVPIQGWGSTVAMSSDTGDGRVVAARYYSNSVATTRVSNTLAYQTRSFDTHNAYDTATGVYTVPIQGIYQIRWSDYFTGAANAIAIWKNSSVYREYATYGATAYSGNGTDTIQCNAGDTIELRISAGTNGNTGSNHPFFSIDRISSGTQQIAATETVAASYYLSTNTNFGTGSFVFDQKIYDSHGSVTTGIPSSGNWKFTAPMRGYYNVSVSAYITTSLVFLNIWKNDSLFIEMLSGSFSGGGLVVGTLSLQLNSGEFINVRTPASSGNVTGGSLSSGSSAKIYIHRIGI